MLPIYLFCPSISVILISDITRAVKITYVVSTLLTNTACLRASTSFTTVVKRADSEISHTWMGTPNPFTQHLVNSGRFNSPLWVSFFLITFIYSTNIYWAPPKFQALCQAVEIPCYAKQLSPLTWNLLSTESDEIMQVRHMSSAFLSVPWQGSKDKWVLKKV